MNSRKCRGLAIALLIATGWTVLVGAAAGQEPSVGSSGDPDGPQLRVSTKISAYRQGELIALDLAYSAKTPNRYKLNLAGYDRSGRMGFERFVVEPIGTTSDPILPYFRSIPGTFAGGLTNFEFLSETPKLVHLDLNEWVRFDKPGRYRVTVVSRRIGDANEGNANLGGVPKEIESNPIDLQITEPDSEWQRSVLQNVLVELNHPATTRWLKPTDPRYSALRQLRYLGSADAAREMARRLKGEETNADWQYMFGLIGSPNWMVGLDEMRKLLVDPDFPVSGMFLNTISILPLDSTNSQESLWKQRSENQKAAREALLVALPDKKGPALAMSLFTVSDGVEPDATPELRSRVLGEFIENFTQLSASQQLDWLDGRWPQSFFQPAGQLPPRWPLVKDPRLVPALRTIAKQYTDFPQPNLSDAYEALKLTGTALIRWYELDPEGARPAVLAEIVRPRPRYSANTLGMLPDKVLPNEQHAIAANFLATDDYIVEGNLASLLNRYADASVLPQVLPKITRKLGGLWACIAENNAVAYVQKVDPEAGKPLAARVTAACRKVPSRADLP